MPSDHRLTPPPSPPPAGDLALLAELSQDLAGTPDLDSTLTNAVAQTLAYMDAEAASLLRQREVPEEAASACRALLAQFDEAMYRPDAATPVPDIVRSLQSLLPAIDAALDAPRPKKEEEP